ncbi:hypothetical protein LCM20_00770 [Halobacillus litoralis]|uniref:hypothetical protein n=1 Tax=Halobacillus litoralis TaxID=45668 RepID=UPI001CD553F7|nr:hypothetical protein [Halobacillus litoralis]MCA0969116.1 hypothetical protein [Halobacillus litoralis]
MAGTIKFNLLIALFGFFFTFLSALSDNVWQTALIRGALGFFGFFIIAFLIRIIWGLISIENEDRTPKEDEGTSEPETGSRESGSESEQGSTEVTAEETSKMIRSLLNEDENNQKTTND